MIRSFQLPAGLKRCLPLGLVGLAAVVAGVVSTQWLSQVAAVPPEKALVHEKTRDGKHAYTPPAWAEPPDPRIMLAQLGLGTLVMLGLCLGIFWFGKRFVNRRPLLPPGNVRLRVAEALPLNRHCCLYLLQVGDFEVLAGVDGSGLKSLVTMPEPFTDTLGKLQPSAAGSANGAAAASETIFAGVVHNPWQTRVTGDH